MDFAIQNVLTNGELRLNLTMITDNDKFFQKHYIARTLFIIIQIIEKTKSRKKYLPRKRPEYKISGIISLSAYAK